MKRRERGRWKQIVDRTSAETSQNKHKNSREHGRTATGGAAAGAGAAAAGEADAAAAVTEAGARVGNFLMVVF